MRILMNTCFLYQQKVIEYSGKLVANKDKEKSQDLQILRDYISNVETSLKTNPAVLMIDKQQLHHESEYLAQLIAVSNKKFTQFNHHPQNKIPLRNEIMTIRKLLAADITNNTQSRLKHCKQQCYRVEMYNYFFNMSII